MTPYDLENAADDFFLNMNLQTALALPDSRESILHFCEAVQKEFRQMTAFYQRETGEYVLEANREAGTYPWLEMHGRRLSAGFFNPGSLQEAYHLHQWLLERSVYYMGLSGMDVECLDILFGFNLDYRGNRDAIVAEALMGNSPIGHLAAEGKGPTVECEPSFVMALDEDCYLQGRMSVETRSNSYQIRTGRFEDEPISVYFTVRRYPQPGRLIDFSEDYPRQCEMCEDVVQRVVVPQIVRPIAAAISTAL